MPVHADSSMMFDLRLALLRSAALLLLATAIGYLLGGCWLLPVQPRNKIASGVLTKKATVQDEHVAAPGSTVTKSFLDSATIRRADDREAVVMTWASNSTAGALQGPVGIARAADGTVFVADNAALAIMTIRTDGSVSVLAGGRLGRT
ncbi:MAG: hypothetical protein HY692_10240, partial [Cyanobacteria bacterium NC_groundwater_1444_Ag_S-0.65um_54_12]|nr:hypothetical protein [Cyanobacteria bacterium NC_groundwater_1444_Ag_S-0.65um_54_12]